MALSPLQDKIVTAIGQSSWANKGHILTHLNRVNSHNHSNIKDFQKNIFGSLNNNFLKSWETEKRFGGVNVNDAIDIYGESDSDICMIEIDATRADQVAKKFLSRLSLSISNSTISKKNLLYVALLYPDTQNGRSECEKYVRYCYDVLRKFKGKDSNVVGIYVDTMKGKNAKTSIELWDFNSHSRFIVSDKNNHQSGIITGMNECAQRAIKLYIKNNRPIKPVTYNHLQNVFCKKNKYNYVFNVSKGKQTKALGIRLGSDDVYVNTQWREYGYGSNWDNFVNLCNSKKVGITIKKIQYIFNEQLGQFV